MVNRNLDEFESLEANIYFQVEDQKSKFKNIPAQVG